MKAIARNIIISLLIIIITIPILGLYYGQRQRSDRVRCVLVRQNIDLLFSGLKCYKIAYGSIFKEGKQPPKEERLTDADYDQLMEHLICTGETNGGSDNISQNSKNATFIEPPPWTPFQNGGGVYSDPWGNRYAIYLDVNNDGVIDLNGEKIKAACLIYSFGPNGKDNNGTMDDICSWR